MIAFVVILLVSYLVGAIPWSWLVVRAARGIDLRHVGSGNLGATNTFRVLGAPGGVLVLALDVLKGWIAPAVFARLGGASLPLDVSLVATCAGVAAIVGHIFPIYLGFRGGKGIATTAGVFLALAPGALAIAFAAFLLGFGASRGIVSVGSLLSALVLPFAIFALESRRATPAWDRVVVGAGLATLIWLKHTSNLARLVRGEEKRLFDRGARATPPAVRS